MKEFEIGQKDNKKVKKEISMNGYVFVVVFGIIMVFFAVGIVNIMGWGGNKTFYFECKDGQTKEKVEYNKTIYCGDHYTILKDKLPPKTYLEVQSVILYNFTIKHD